MQNKKKKWSAIKEILFAYLAISKMMYYYDAVMASEQFNLQSSALAVLNRLLNRDIMLIAGVVLIYFFEKLMNKFITSKSKIGSFLQQGLLYIVGYVGMIAIIYAYFLTLSLFGEVNMPSLYEFVSSSILGYAVIAVAISIKYYFKDREKEAPEHKIYMLQTLCDDGIITQEECNRICEKIQN